MTCTLHRASRSCNGATVTERRGQSRDDEAGAILPSKRRGGVKPNVSLNAEQTLSQTDLTNAPIRANQTNRRAKVLPSSKLPMLQQEAESSRMSMLAKVSPRENSLVFLGAELPMLREQISFFMAKVKLPQARLTTEGRTDRQFNCRVLLWANSAASLGPARTRVAATAASL